MWLCQQYSARQQFAIFHRVINKPLLQEGYVPPPPDPTGTAPDPRAPKVDPAAENDPLDSVE